MTHPISALERAMVLLKPLIRLFLRWGVSYKDFTHATKRAFVEVAEDELRRVTKNINKSRISVMTGIHREIVDEILQNRTQKLEQGSSFMARVLARWENDRRFTTAKREPRVLTFLGEDSEFERLIRLEGTHIHPGTVLFELERSGQVERTAQGLRLLKAFTSFEIDPQRSTELTARNMATLLFAAEENLFQTSHAKNTSIRTEFDKIYADKVPEIRSWVLERSQEFHKRVREYLVQHDADFSPRDQDAPLVTVSYVSTSHVEVREEKQELQTHRRRGRKF